MDLSRLRLQALDLAKERSDLESSLIKHERFVKGSLVYLRTRCGKRGCRCHRHKKHRHGRHLYLSLSLNGRTRMVYVPKPWVQKTEEWVKQARSYRETRKQWLRITQRLWKIWMEMEGLKTQPLPYEPRKKGR